MFQLYLWFLLTNVSSVIYCWICIFMPYLMSLLAKVHGVMWNSDGHSYKLVNMVITLFGLYLLQFLINVWGVIYCWIRNFMLYLMNLLAKGHGVIWKSDGAFLWVSKYSYNTVWAICPSVSDQCMRCYILLDLHFYALSNGATYKVY